MRAIYKRRRDVLVESFGRAGWEVPPPRASMFAWAPIPEPFQSIGSVEFSTLLVEKAEVAVSPGIGFGEHGEGYVRIALVENEQRIRQAARNVRRFLETGLKKLHDVFVELSGGEGDPAKAAVSAALAAKKSVVTANKALLARHGVTLATIAEKNHVALNFEAAVGGAIPIVKTLREGLAGNSLARIYGILNGTCNYILTRMEEEKLAFADCLKEAQQLGYAEADPTFDLEGHDTP